MHELSIATQVLDAVLATAAAHGATAVEEVELAVGAMRLVVPEALAGAFEIVAEGTVAQGARLKMLQTPLRAQCRHCARSFDPQIDNYRCPACGRADVEIVEGNDIILTSVSCRVDDPVPPPSDAATEPQS